MQARAGFDTGEVFGQLGNAEEGGGAAHAQFCLAGGSFDEPDAQPGGAPQQLGQGQGKAQQHAAQQVGEDDAQRRGGVDDYRDASVLAEVAHGPGVDQLAAGVHQYRAEAGHRDALQQAGEEGDQGQQPGPVEDGRGAAAGAGLDVGRAAYDHPGHRQGTDSTAEYVADALGGQFAVEAGARAIVHAVYGCGGEQGLGAGDEGHRQGGDEQLRIGQAGQPLRSNPVDGIAEVGWQFHAFDRQGQPQADQCGEGHADQGAGQKTQGCGAVALPQPHADKGAEADCTGDHRVATEQAQRIAHGAGEGQQVVQAGGPGRGVDHHVHLRQHDKDADTGEHAVDHGGGRYTKPAAQAQRAGDQLDQAGEQQYRAERGHALGAHQLEHQYGEPRRRATDLQRRAREKTDHQAADDAGDQALGRRHAGGDGDAHAQRQGDEKDHHGCQCVPWQCAKCIHRASSLPVSRIGLAMPVSSMARAAGRGVRLAGVVRSMRTSPGLA